MLWRHRRTLWLNHHWRRWGRPLRHQPSSTPQEEYSTRTCTRKTRKRFYHPSSTRYKRPCTNRTTNSSWQQGHHHSATKSSCHQHYIQPDTRSESAKRTRGSLNRILNQQTQTCPSFAPSKATTNARDNRPCWFCSRNIRLRCLLNRTTSTTQRLTIQSSAYRHWQICKLTQTIGQHRIIRMVEGKIQLDWPPSTRF